MRGAARGAGRRSLGSDPPLQLPRRGLGACLAVHQADLHDVLCPLLHLPAAVQDPILAVDHGVPLGWRHGHGVGHLGLRARQIVGGAPDEVLRQVQDDRRGRAGALGIGQGYGSGLGMGQG